jgi:proteic killer suppression protein
MEVIFKKKYLQEIYQTGKGTDKKHRFQLSVVRKFIRVIDIMIDQPDTVALKKFSGLNYEKLKGDKAGLSSVRVNDQYRIEFEERSSGEQSVATICSIVE